MSPGTELVALCGMNCGICLAYLRKEMPRLWSIQFKKQQVKEIYGIDVEEV